jgi:hypothetical protein
MITLNNSIKRSRVEKKNKNKKKKTPPKTITISLSRQDSKNSIKKTLENNF